MGFGFGPMGGYGMGWFGMILNIAFLVLVIYGAILIFKSASRNDKGRTDRPTAIDILKERYAKGEISSEDFQRMKKELE